MPQPEYTLEPVDHDPFEDAHGTGPTGNVAGSVSAIGQQAVDWYRNQPSWAEKAHAVDQQSDAMRAAGASEGDIALATRSPRSDLLGGFVGSTMKAPGIFQGALTGKLAAATKPPGQTFYHASPHDFSQFDSSKIGTGEGAQAYGHGLYVAENPDVARQYRQDFKQRFGKAITYEGTINADPDHFLHWDKPISEQSPFVQKALKKIDDPELDPYDEDPSGEMIHSDLSSHHHMGIEDDLATQDKLAKQIPASLSLKQAQAKLATLQESEAQKRTAEQLKDAGIVGIKYMDRDSKTNALAISVYHWRIQKSKDAIAAGQPMTPDGGMDHASLINSASNRLKYLQGQPMTHNYVIFNDKILDIVKKYGMAGLISGGAAHFTTTQTDEDPFNAPSPAH